MLSIEFWFLIYVLIIFKGGILAHQKRRSELGWALICALFPIALVVIWCIGPAEKPWEERGDEFEFVKICPFCAEEIKAAAKVCKHCGRDIPGME